MAANGSLDGPTMKLRSGRTIGKWHIAQAKLRHNINMVGDNIKFDFTDPPDPRLRPMSQVFNIPELLEEILLNLGPTFLLQRVQKVCRGFKDSLEGSPTFRQRSSFAVRVDNGVPFALLPNLIPKSLVMSPRSANSDFYFLFSGDSGPTTLESHRSMRRLTGMHMFDSVPQWIFAYWKLSDRRVSSKAWMVEDGGSAVTFGELFDAVAAQHPADCRLVVDLHVVWPDSRGW